MLAVLGKGPGYTTLWVFCVSLVPTIFVKHNDTRYIKKPISNDTFRLWSVPEYEGQQSAKSGNNQAHLGFIEASR